MKVRFWRRAVPWLAGALVAAAAPALAAPDPTPTPWPWPAIPSCLADPSTPTQGAVDRASPVCAVYDAVVRAASEVELVSAPRANAAVDGVLYPAFLPGSEVVRFVPGAGFLAALGAGNTLVRASHSAAAARSGSWWTTQRQVSDARGFASPDRIRAILALTGEPSCLAFASDVAHGVFAYMGVVAPAFDEPGGGVEFWFPPDAVVATRTLALTGSGGC